MSQDTQKPKHREDPYLTPLYGRKEFAAGAPKKAIPDHPMAPDSAYQMITDELLLDGRPGLNFATFVNTYVDEWGRKLVIDNLDKNYIDHEEYPASNLAEKRCIWMLATEYGTTFDWDDTDPDTAEGLYGSATIGTSEAVMLGLIAHKHRWTKNNIKNLERKMADPQDRPVVLMSAHAHSCWDKFCRYFGALGLYVKLDCPPYTISGSDVRQILETKIEDPASPYAQRVRDCLGYSKSQGERTIGELVMAVGAIVCTTFTGNSDDIKGIDDEVEAYCKTRVANSLGLDIPIHVDAASAGFILPFSSNGSEVPFTFKNTKRVYSINVSNHKFGMTYPGMGSVIFRDSKVVDQSLVYDVTYLGGSFKDYTVNFSRGTSMILLQYYNFLRFGRSGYQHVIDNCLNNTKHFVNGIRSNATLGKLFMPISDWEHLPIVVLTWDDGIVRPSWSLADLSHELRVSGWIVPAYTLPKTSPDPDLPPCIRLELEPIQVKPGPDEGRPVLRVVVQQKVSGDKLQELITDMETAVNKLNKSGAPWIPRLMFKGDKC